MILKACLSLKSICVIKVKMKQAVLETQFNVFRLAIFHVIFIRNKIQTNNYENSNIHFEG